MNKRFSSVLALLLICLMTASAVHAETVPANLLYEGRILNSSGQPVTSAVVLRFSFWKSSDFTGTDVSAGVINTGAANYGAWTEVQTITPNSNGIIQVKLGDVTPLPTLNVDTHKYIQVEAKADGQPDTSYVLLDPTGDNGADAVDRKIIGSVAYAKNADSVGNRTVGTASGNLLILGPGGKVTVSQMGSGTTSQSFAINADNAAGDTILTFGNILLSQTLKYSAANQRFEFSASVHVQGSVTASSNLSGSSLTVSGLKACDSVDTDANGNLICGTDAGAGVTMSQADADARYLKKAGGTMTGQLTIANGAGLTASGTIATAGGVTINKNNTAADAVLSFGSALGTKALTYSSVNRQFEFNDNVSVTGNLSVSGQINGTDFSSIAPLRVSSGAGLTINVAAGSYRLGNTLVNFTGSSGIAVASNTTNYVFFGSGGLTVRLPAFPTDESFIPLAVVTTSVTGVTGVTDRRISQSDTREHAVLQLLTPEYDKVTYQGDAADNVGTLSMSQDNMTHQNYYVWTTTRSTLQDYDIFVRVQVPQDFVRWKSGGGRNNVHLNYRSTSANASDNALDLSVFDTNGTPVSLSATMSGLASTSWATAQIDFLGTPTWQPGQEFLLKFHLSAKNGYQIQLGSVELNSTHLTGQ